jgi:hypothetical protein
MKYKINRDCRRGGSSAQTGLLNSTRHQKLGCSQGSWLLSIQGHVFDALGQEFDIYSLKESHQNYMAIQFYVYAQVSSNV